MNNIRSPCGLSAVLRFVCRCHDLFANFHSTINLDKRQEGLWLEEMNGGRIASVASNVTFNALAQATRRTPKRFRSYAAAFMFNSGYCTTYVAPPYLSYKCQTSVIDYDHTSVVWVEQWTKLDWVTSRLLSLVGVHRCEHAAGDVFDGPSRVLQALLKKHLFDWSYIVSWFFLLWHGAYFLLLTFSAVYLLMWYSSVSLVFWKPDVFNILFSVGCRKKHSIYSENSLRSLLRLTLHATSVELC